MRVLQLIDSLEAGGAERMAVNMANALVAKIERSYLCTTRAEGVLRDGLSLDVGYLFLKRTKTLDLGALKHLWQFVKQERITVVHAHSSSYFMATQLKLIVPSITLIWHDHYGNSEFLDQRPVTVLKWCSYFFKAIITVNAQLARWDRTHLHCKQVQFLPNFVMAYDTEAVTTLKGTIGKRILCLANLRAQKDHITLLYAFKKVLGVAPDWTLHCVGKDFNDAYSAAVRDEVTVLDLDNRVFFYGSCPDSSHIIGQVQLGVLSSASEGLPLALLEYGQGGLAVVATDVGDCKQVIPTTDCGTLVPAADAEALANALLRYIEDSELRNRTAKALKGYVAEQFSEEAILERLLTIYA
ncbi:glycosyltransferase [Winogradskyella sp. F6397]|uniref:Glycosyltransferase n=1 Tax=Winogradskyella marina TaxID=2785530 RepID=A0ABS0EKK7_9FLAO|nr:glycosyltransferase [Winogradskyella marina]MBF8150994.1 glycosyltransferase [Winogradskyella marina]